MVTLADATRHGFERTHPRGKNTLLCVGLCRQRKDRLDFRELPTHGRAASCMSCEGYTWRHTYDDRVQWQLDQAREKLRMYQRYAAFLKYANFRPRYVMGLDASTSADAFRAYESPYRAVLERSARKWTAAWYEALSKAHTFFEEETR
ncbi:hypothetical protein [Streptomyces sp. NPDC006638]|uniref:hypothetical protein n=1 Tax=Streptomyces sp. NPDC006638 TaxID=3157183 RepID=UPI0033A0A154